MPMLGPLAVPLLKGGIGLGTSLIASKLAGGKRKEDQEALANQNAAMKQQMDTSGALNKSGSSLVDLARGNFGSSSDYYSKILSGDKAGIASGLAPEISRIGEGYGTALNTISSLAPRGGGRSSLLSDLPFKQQHDVSSLMQTARPGAATGLAQVGAQSGSLGANLFSNSINALNGSTSAGRTVLDYNQRKREDDRAMGAGFGSSIFELLKGLDFGSLGKGGKSTGKGTATGGPLGEFP